MENHSYKEVASLGTIWNLNEIVKLIQEKAATEGRAAGDVLQEIVAKLKEAKHNGK